MKDKNFLQVKGILNKRTIKPPDSVFGIIVSDSFFLKVNMTFNKTCYDSHNEDLLPKNHETSFICGI